MTIENKVEVAHDYQCPWCWVSAYQSVRLRQNYPEIVLDWKGYVLLPNPSEAPSQRPLPSKRFLRLLESEQLVLPASMPPIVDTIPALLTAEHIKHNYAAFFDAFNLAVYRAFWEEGRDISNQEVLTKIASESGIAGFAGPSEEEAGGLTELLTKWDEADRDKSIAYLTTFTFKGEQCAEASYSVISEMAERFLERSQR